MEDHDPVAILSGCGKGTVSLTMKQPQLQSRVQQQERERLHPRPQYQWLISGFCANPGKEWRAGVSRADKEAQAEEPPASHSGMVGAIRGFADTDCVLAFAVERSPRLYCYDIAT